MWHLISLIEGYIFSVLFVYSINNIIWEFWLADYMYLHMLDCYIHLRYRFVDFMWLIIMPLASYDMFILLILTYIILLLLFNSTYLAMLIVLIICFFHPNLYLLYIFFILIYWLYIILKDYNEYYMLLPSPNSSSKVWTSKV